MTKATDKPEGNAKDTAGILAPPPLIYLSCFLIGVGLDYLWPADFLPQAVQYGVGLAILAVGLVRLITAFRAFQMAGTQIDPYKPTTTVITTGPFATSRNPIYVALTLIFIGIGVTYDSLWTLAMVLPAIAILHYGVILREEAYLEQKFGDDYRAYKSTVRRWL